MNLFKNIINFFYRITHKEATIKQKFPCLFADQIPSVKPLYNNISQMKFKYVNNYKMKAGDYGHEWMLGDFVVNEKGEEIYLGHNPDEYHRLMKLYNNI